MNINLNLLKYFYVVAKYCSYTEAANKLNISQPSLSYSIKTLESQLGIKMFYKQNNKIFLTTAGVELYEKVEKMMNIIDSIDILNNSEEKIYNITFGLRSLYAIKIFPKIANRMVETYPNIKLDFVVGTSSELEKMLLNHRVDIIIDEREYGDCYSKMLGQYNSYFITTKAALEQAKRNHVSIEKILEKGIYLVERNSTSKWLAKQYPNLDFKFVQTTPILIDRIKNDNVIGIGHELAIQDELQNGDIVRIKPYIKIPKSKLYIQCLNESMNKRIKEIIEFYSIN